MKRIGFTGPATREKIFLMCYLGKVLSCEATVLVVPGCQWFGDGLDFYEYSHQLTISTGFDQSHMPDYLLEEAYVGSPNHYDAVYGVVDLLVHMAVMGKDHFDGPSYKGPTSYIFMNLIMDSSINDHYLIERLGLSEAEGPPMVLYLDDGDICASIENSYERRLDMKGLSKPYRKLLMTLTSQVLNQPMTASKKLVKKAERSH